MRFQFGLVVIATTLGAATQAAAEDATATAPRTIPSDTLALARELSANGSVPLGTVLTDLITKGSTLNIESGLGAAGQPPHVWLENRENAGRMSYETTSIEHEARRPGPTLNSRSEYLDPSVAIDPAIATQALDKGYTPRTIEFDPRFENNVERAAVASDIADTQNNGRIWQGIVVTEPDPFPDAVAILGNNHICSGTLVAPDKVLTAAHCFCGGVMADVVMGQTTFSSQRIAVDKNGSEVFQSCSRLPGHLGDGDIALLKLSTPVKVAPRALTSLQVVRDSASVRAVGFGKTDQGAIGVKYQINIVIASFQCDGTDQSGKPDSQTYHCEPAHELVAAGLNRDTCGGDSGGPIYVFGPDNQPYLAGVTSRAIVGDKCGPGGIYTLTSAPPIKAWLEARGVTVP